MRALIADDARLVDVPSRALADAGWQVDIHHDGCAAVNVASQPASQPGAAGRPTGGKRLMSAITRVAAIEGRFAR